MTVLQFLHTSLEIADVERSRQFYADLIGLTELERPFSFPGLWFQVGSLQLHLIVTHSTKNTSQAEFSPSTNASLGRGFHVAMAVEDLQSMKQRLEKAGYRVQMSRSGREAFFVQDPDGNPLEFSQHKSSSD